MFDEKVLDKLYKPPQWHYSRPRIWEDERDFNRIIAEELGAPKYRSVESCKRGLR